MASPTYERNTSRYRSHLFRGAGAGVLSVVIAIAMMISVVMNGFALQDRMRLLISFILLLGGVVAAWPYFVDIFASSIPTLTGVVDRIEDDTWIAASVTFPFFRCRLFISEMELVVDKKELAECIVEGKKYQISYAPTTRLVLSTRPLPEIVNLDSE